MRSSPELERSAKEGIGRQRRGGSRMVSQGGVNVEQQGKGAKVQVEVGRVKTGVGEGKERDDRS